MSLTCFECGRDIEGTYAILMFLGHTDVRFVGVEHARIKIILCDGHESLNAHAHDVSHFAQPNIDTIGFAFVPGGYQRRRYSSQDTPRMLENCRLKEARYISERVPDIFPRSFSRLIEFLERYSMEHADFRAGMVRFLDRRQSTALCKTELLSDKIA